MRTAIFILLFMAPNMSAFGQSLSQFKRDSIEYMKECNCEVSKAKYTDQDGIKYHVYLDKDTHTVFFIRKIKFGRKVRAEKVIIS